MGTARLRAAHQVLDDDPKVLHDPIAVGLVPGSREAEIRANAESFQTPTLRAIRAVLVMRSRYVEDVLGEVVRSGVCQYVVLGAGVDTFAYRQPTWAHILSLFEIDHPATQAWKRTILQEQGIALPRNLRFCPVDFETTSLSDGLNAVGFDFQSPTLFSWLGVTQYLTDAAINSSLSFVSSMPPRSSIVLSLVLPDACLGPEDREVRIAAAEIALSRGEPWLTQIEPTALCRRLTNMGFSQTIDLTPAAANERYFQGRHDGLRVPGYEHVMWATV